VSLTYSIATVDGKLKLSTIQDDIKKFPPPPPP